MPSFPNGEEAKALTQAYPERYPIGADQESDEDPEKFAQEAGVDPTAQEVDEYREMIGDPPPEPD
jgi:hypothetical protein